MAGQVGKLTLKAVIDGFEDVQGLGKAIAIDGVGTEVTQVQISIDSDMVDDCA